MAQRFVALITTIFLLLGQASSAPTTVAGSRLTKPWKPKIPISLPIQQSTDPGAITFDNVLDHVGEIPEVAWSRVQDRIAAHPPVAIKVNVFTGPNTSYDVVGGTARVAEVVQRTARLWAGFSQVRVVDVLSYNFQDLAWAKRKWKSIVKSRHYPKFDADRATSFGLNCPNDRCNGANADTTDATGDGNIALGQTGTSNDQFIKLGGVVSHEYSHVVEATQWLGANGCRFAGKPCTPRGDLSNNFSACWLNEGLVNATGNMVATDNLADFLRWDEAKYYGWGPTTATDYTQSSLFNYLYSSGTVPACIKKDAQLYRLGYSVGAAASEVLIAIAGPESLMALFARGAAGDTFAKAFKRVYGISWKRGATILSYVLAAEYAKAGPPPF
jgi:hypothetical protein